MQTDSYTYEGKLVQWTGAGWYILDMSWKPAQSLEELDEAHKNDQDTAYLTQDILEDE
jgi:hypothetical protein